MAAKKAVESSGSPQETSGALAKMPMSALSSASMPAWLQKKMEGQAPKGMEKVDSNDLIYPRLMLMQGTSPLVADGKRMAGEVVDNLTNDVIAKFGERFLFIPVVFSKNRLMFKPREQGGGLACRSDDMTTARAGGAGVDRGGSPTSKCEECVNKEWDSNDKPKCNVSANIIGLLPEFGMRPYVISGMKTQLPMMKKLVSLCKQTGADFYAHAFNLFSVGAESGGNKYKLLEFEAAGWASEEAYAAGEKFFKSLAGKTWSADTSDLEKEVTGQAADTTFP